jgi:Flp pilus assembly protein TadG
MMRMNLGRRSREGGQALVETAIVILLILSLSMAIIDFGRMLMLLNMVTSATRDAARVASAVNHADRTVAGAPCNEGAIKDIVVNQLADVGLDLDPDADVGITQDAGNPGANIPATITVTTSVAIPWIALFNFVGSDLEVSRSVTFKDESPTGDGCS